MSLATYNVSVGLSVEDLTISLPLQAGYPARLVRHCLRLTTNVEALVLNLPPTTPRSMLNEVALPKIRVFSTNLSHNALPRFLMAHPSITSLVLHRCGRKLICPLRSIDLDHVTELQCPSGCLGGLARGQVACATVNLTRTTSSSMLAIRFLSTSPLYSLTIDFFSDDFDVMMRVVDVVVVYGQIARSP